MGDKKKRGKRAANNAGDGFPIPHPDAIEIKTVPEQIIKLELSIKVQSKDTLNNEKQIKRI